MDKAIIFNIQKFSVHDGPGIRTTVFFKGCPLKCMWCHNPESQNSKIEMLYDKEKCTLCGNCANICPENAIKIENNELKTDLNLCSFCDECTIYCLNKAREIAGREYTVDETMNQVMKDKVFYKQSKGGVTVSGGEPLSQIAFVEELLKRLKAENIHTAVDTCGAVGFESLKRAAKYTDLFLYDLKIMDDELHKKYIGSSNRIIIENLIKLSKIHSNISIRLPIIEGINAYPEHIESVINLIEKLNVKKVYLLPYHNISAHKYKKLGLKYEDEKMSKPSDEKMKSFKEMFEKRGFVTKIGG